MRALILSSLALGLLSAPAYAHPEQSKPKTDVSELKLPTKAEMQDVLDKMPDFNALMGDFMELAQDEELKNSLTDAGEAFVEKLDESGALKTDKNGLPNFNKMMEVMLFAFTEDDIAGELVGTLSEFQDVIEKHIPEDQVKKID